MTWDDTQESLARSLRELPDRGFVVLKPTEPPGRLAIVHHRRLAGLITERRATASPFVQFLRMENDLRGECVGSEGMGGPFPLTDEEHERDLGLGWVVPSHEGFFSENYECDWRGEGPPPSYLSAATAGDAAGLGVRTIRQVFGCPRPEALDIVVEHNRPRT